MLSTKLGTSVMDPWHFGTYPDADVEHPALKFSSLLWSFLPSWIRTKMNAYPCGYGSTTLPLRRIFNLPGMLTFHCMSSCLSLNFLLFFFFFFFKPCLPVIISTCHFHLLTVDLSACLWAVTVVRIRDILVRIRGSASLTIGYGSSSGSCSFLQWPSRR